MNRASIYGVTRKAVNDNVSGSSGVGLGVTSIAEALKCETLDAALRHFADHGLAAARNARRQAEEALSSGDDKSYSKWLEICRSLDRRMARDLDGRKDAMLGHKVSA